MRFVALLVSIAALVALVVAPVMAQTAAPGTPARPAPGLGPATAPEKPSVKEVEGTVKNVDSGKKSVQVSSGVLGLFGATLEIDDTTKINVQGKEGSIADIREGAKVKASYESRDGRNVAKSIDVMPGGDEAVSSPARSTAPGAAPSGSPSAAPGSSAPASQPKTQ